MEALKYIESVIQNEKKLFDQVQSFKLIFKDEKKENEASINNTKDKLLKMVKLRDRKKFLQILTNKKVE